ncbi:MAG: endonuclease III [spirochete symbiont of Stewartia floridana]|nr:MAG: endonuclease III [spirochete symbiont of Stewartia floridana]
MIDETRLNQIMDRLKEKYPDRRTLLRYINPFELAMSVALSAQTTDAAVNNVTPVLFSRWPTPSALAGAVQEEVEEVIHSLGFFRQKARNLIAAARLLTEEFGGDVPQSMEDLTSLPGIGRKSANVIRGHIWNLPGIIVDTHFGRVCRRLGLTEQNDPYKVEMELSRLIPEDRQHEFSMTVNFHGRRYCMSRKPNCHACFLRSICPYGIS